MTIDTNKIIDLLISNRLLYGYPLFDFRSVSQIELTVLAGSNSLS